MIELSKYSISDLCRLKRLKIVFGLFCFASLSSIAQINTSIDSTQIRIGEELKLTIQVEADSTDLVVFPEGLSFLPLEVLESYKVDTTYENATYQLIKKYGLTQFDSGSYTIPSQRVFINEKLFVTDSIKIEVRDVPVDTTQQKMFDIKPATEVKSPPFDLLKMIYWLLPILLIIGFLWMFFRRRKKRIQANEKQLPPYEEAIFALRALDGSELLKQDRSKEYYTQLTEIVKRYLDREVDESALESTSDELISRLQLHKDAGHFDFDKQTIDQLDQILKRADLVKFAKMRQEMGQAEADRNAVEAIINETHEVIPEPSEEELLRNEEYSKEQKRKKKRKNIIRAVAATFIALLITGVLFTGIYGWSYVRDTVFGHPVKELLEGEWVHSEYGVPAVILETPEVLIRSEQSLGHGEFQNGQVSNDVFSYGNLDNTFYIMVNVATYKEGVELDFDKISEELLNNMEQQGATNLIVKRETFNIKEEVESEKIYGEFDFRKVNSSDKPVKKEYEILLFKKGQAIQALAVYFEKDDVYAPQVKGRIINSVELEISEK